MDYPKFSSFEVQVTIGEGKSAVAGAEPPLRGNPIARAPSSVWSRLVDHTERREAGDTQDTQEEEEVAEEEGELDPSLSHTEYGGAGAGVGLELSEFPLWKESF